MCGQERAIALGTIAKKLASQDFAKAFAALATCAHIQPSTSYECPFDDYEVLCATRLEAVGVTSDVTERKKVL